VISNNPLEKVKTPRITRKKVDALDESQCIEFIAELQSEPIEMRCIVLLLLFAGIRRGELVGLKWGDIDFIRKTICVQRNVTYTKGSGIIIGTPKTSESTRVIPLPSIVEEALKEYIEQLDYEVSTDCFLFPRIGEPTSPRDPNAITKRMKRFVLRHNLPDVSPHDLRHTCASLLLVSGADIKSVQEILGHSDAATTLNYYAKSTMPQMQLASELMVNRLI
jgi:integrase